MIGALQEIWEGFDFSLILGVLLSVIPSLVCITLHELSHGLVAYALGDDTAKRAGRLSLNPIRHLDWMGLLMMVVAHVGWAKPVPVNMMNFRDPKRGMAVTALAGPASNVLITCLFFFLYGLVLRPLLLLGAAGEYLLQMLQLTATISIGLAVFNLLPVPPLDGFNVATEIFHLENTQFHHFVYRNSMVILMVLIILDVPHMLLTPPTYFLSSFITSPIFHIF